MKTLRLLAFLAMSFSLHCKPADAQSSPEGDVERGRRIWSSHGCYQCHGTQGQGSNAGSRLAPDPIPYEAFRQLVRQPRARMPPYSPRILSDQDLADIHAYLRTIPKARSVSEIPLLRATPEPRTRP